MNVKLLEQVKEHILAEPKRLDMNILGDATDKPIAEIWPACGTVGCIAGWGALLRVPDWKQLKAVERGTLMTWDAGKAALELTEEEADRLFTEPSSVTDWDEEEVDWGWPTDFAEQYEHATTHQERAQVTAERIEHFIKTKGRE